MQEQNRCQFATPLSESLGRIVPDDATVTAYGYMALKTIRLRAVGECVYCGALENLSDEHIVPFALGGTLVLPDASCPQCANITSAFERRVLRGFMYRARVTGKFPTRRPKRRPSTHTVTLLRGNEIVEIALAPPEEPGLLQLPLLAPPQFFSGVSSSDGVVVRGLETLYFGINPEQFVRSHRASGLRQSDQLDVVSFVRMIAKIGYCYICGTLGIPPRSEVPVLPFILGARDDGSRWVGSVSFATRAERDGANIVLAHTIYQSNEDPSVRVLVARVKLFAGAGATGYEVLIHRESSREARCGDAA